MVKREALLAYRVEVFKALADLTRLEIVEFLRDGEKCVCEIIPAMGKAQSTVSKHLEILHRAGILDRRVDGKRVLYRIKDPILLKILKSVDDLILNRLIPLAKTLKVLKVAKR